MTRPRTIFISGWGTGNEVWDRLVGCFKNEPDAVFIPWWECLTDDRETNALWKALSETPDPVVLAGASLGGMVSLKAASRHADKIAGLVLFCTTARKPSDDGYPGTDLRVLKAMRLKLIRNATPVLQSFAEKCIAPHENESFCHHFVRRAGRIDRDTLASGLEYLETTDMRSALPQLTMPALIIHGEQDRVVPVVNARYLAEHLPNAQITVLPDTGHALWCDTGPEHIAQLVEQFLDNNFVS